MRLPGQVQVLWSPDDGAGGGTPPAPATSSATSGGGADGGVVGTPSASPSDAPLGSDNSFDGFDPNADMDEVTIPEPQANEGSVAATPADKGAVPAKKDSVTPPGGDQTPKVAETAPQPQQVQQVPAQASSAPTSEISGIVQGLDKEAGPLRDWLAQNVYALTKEEKDGLETEAWTVIPKLLSRVHLELSKSVLQQIENFVPRMTQQAIGRFKESSDKRSEALGSFYKANPSLKAGDHDAVVDQYARMFRANNPRASREEAFKFVGAAVAAHFGIVPSAAPADGTPKRNGSTPPPFQPARPGARQITQTPVAGDEWSGLGQTFDEE